MQITMSRTGSKFYYDVSATMPDEHVGIFDVVELHMNGLYETVKKFLKMGDCSDKEVEDLCFRLEDVFEYFLYERCFPQLKSLKTEFELSDAAIIKAQDEIISDAEARGITFQQALDEYNDKAREYIHARTVS